MQVMLNEWRYLDDEAKTRIIGSRDRYETTWQAVIELPLPRNCYLRKTPDCCVCIYWGGELSVTWYRDDGGLTVEQPAERMLSMTLRR